MSPSGEPDEMFRGALCNPVAVEAAGGCAAFCWLCCLLLTVLPVCATLCMHCMLQVSLTAGSWIYQPSTKGMPAPPGSPTSATASFTVFLGISPYLARQALLTYPVTFNPKNQNTFPFTYQTYNNPLITAAWSVARGSTPTAILTALRAKYNTANASRSAWDALSPVGPVNHATFARIMYEEGFASEPVAAALKAASEPQPGTALRMACYNALQNARGGRRLSRVAREQLLLSECKSGWMA